MSGYVKELLLDLALNRLPSEQKSDMIQAIEKGIYGHVFTLRDVLILCKYITGYTAQEIGVELHITTEAIELTLARIIRSIETLSGYTDVSLVRRAESNGRYTKGKLNQMSLFLLKHGQRFMSHDVFERKEVDE